MTCLDSQQTDHS